TSTTPPTPRSTLFPYRRSSDLGKLHYHPQRNLHGYHQALLDESGRIESVDFRSDYRSWFWSQAPNLDPDATGLGWNDFDAKPYRSEEHTSELQSRVDLVCRLLL